ncbi:hypothetical protein ACT4WE_05915 [Acinetobacter baumannii]
MHIKRGVKEYSFEELVEVGRRKKYINIHQELTCRLASYMEVFEAQFSGTLYKHSFDLIQTSLVDYFVDKKDLVKYEFIEAIYEDICGWSNNGLKDLLVSQNIDLDEYKYNYLKFSDYCFELFISKVSSSTYSLILNDSKETLIKITEADFFALCILAYSRVHIPSKDHGYNYKNIDEAFEEWNKQSESFKNVIPIQIFYNKVLNEEYWFSIINELFIYFQNSLIRNGQKIAISKEKSRIAKIRAEKEAKEREPKLKKLEKLWVDGKWAQKGRGKYTQFAKYIIYNDMIDGMEFDAIRVYISTYDKIRNEKC